MAINPENVANITKEAYSALKSKALGGVSKESAQNAISEAVNKAVRLGEEAVGKVQQEMYALRNKTAQEIAEMTSQKDAFVFQAKQDAVQQIQQAKQEAAEAVKKAKATKSAERMLPNGHKEVRSVNKNGAVMVKEYNEAGQLLKSNVTTLDGAFRRTSYDPVNKTPLKTVTNTSGKDLMIEYKEYGQHKISQVNNKKVKPQKPTLVSQTRPEYTQTGWSGERGMKFDRIYSDGSKETITRVTNSDGSRVERTELVRFDKDGNKVYDKTNWATNATREHIYKGDKIISKESYIKGGETYKMETETIYDPNTGNRVIVKAIKSDNTCTTSYNVIKDEFGFYTGNYEAKTTYPKGSGKKPSISEATLKDIPHIF